MDKNRRNKKYSNWNNQKNNNNQQNLKDKDTEQKQKTFQFNHTAYEDENARKERQKIIQEIKAREIICPKCGQPVTDVASAMADKTTGAPMHFECVLNEVGKNETLLPNEKIAYIGHGRFGILYYENIRDQKHFQIKKIIEWENSESVSPWREELSSVFSKID